MQQAIAFQYSRPDSAILLAEQLLSSDDQKVRSNAYEVIGIAHWVSENYVAAIEAHGQALELRSDIDYQSGIGHSYNNLGLNYQSLGDAQAAMEQFLKAQRMAEELGDTSLLARVLGNIGTLYEEQGAIENALEFHGKSLQVLETGSDDRVLGNTLHNISLIYQRQGEYDKALNFSQRSLSIRSLTHDSYGKAQSLNLLGVIRVNLEEFSTADLLFHRALALYDSLNSAYGRSMVHVNLGESANLQGRFGNALHHCTISMHIAETKNLEWKESACKCLAEAHTRLGNIERSAAYWRRLVSIRDSVQQQNALSEIDRQQKRYEFEKEQLRSQQALDRQRLESEAEIERQKVLRQAALGLGTMGIVLFFMAFRSYRVKQRDNELLAEMNNEISAKNAVIEEKNLHITDSIRYAQNLQAAILPKEEEFEKHFNDFHILYRPKDIVSGDFYWMESLPLPPSQGGGTRIYLAVADCTGHGVPGAMVSMVGFQGLNKAVLEEGRTSPGKILQRLSDHVEEAFEKSGGSVKDGMDICLCVIDPVLRTVSFAGAHNPLWVLTEKEDLSGARLRDSMDGRHCFELKGDRRSIGGYLKALPFREGHLQLSAGDRLFMFSDGYADQFGGPKNKKMGSKRMRQTLMKHALEGKMSGFDRAFDDWKGEQEQVDDVTVISVTL